MCTLYPDREIDVFILLLMMMIVLMVVVMVYLIKQVASLNETKITLTNLKTINCCGGGGGGGGGCLN